MIFDVSKRNFGYKDSLFNNRPVYLATSRIGTFRREDGGIGPVDCGAISQRKRKSVLKAFSESIERRALVIGARGDAIEGLAESFDIMNRKVAKIPRRFTQLCKEDSIVCDTTGTAAHFNSKLAQSNAIKELLEKNSTFLFWYGRQGKKIDLSQHYSIYVSLFQAEGYQVQAYVEETFKPLKVVFVFAKNANHITPFTFMTGVGSSISLSNAIHKGLSEAYLLKNVYDDYFYRYQLEGLEPSSYTAIVLKAQTDSECLKHLELFNKLDTYQEVDEDITLSEAEVETDLIVKNLPVWVKELHTTVLYQTVNKNLIIIKAYSPNLYNHVALKTYIDLDRDVNRYTVNLTQDTLNHIPTCPIL
ncbi:MULTISPECIES: YcaO-like family protein [Brevibacillus]|jgi:Uncharacterized conserved protein|uniref:YcaO domain-containing protein n=1 Tax=Brevibacillus parabrevis TaxID=54914 RepID=A0A4Y3PRJ7_BREPA|nr:MULTISPECIES: YcaO-like family protein [Brevibacillus]MED2255307.1 YcaO-like family protein [Brevibacillus parabrevis]RNB92583.1 hypothetical protein EDM60_25925 [Brevibacillus parabrevis]UED68450.1 YcaO-like family protein [Brevibacillus sp. HD3.3A]WDV94724.1 YcaO-like family protein [Brevibacillus parabrevis]GEB35565.1 hypothetical protein BPA01_51450 [Brevibacillus parabrevis]